MIRNDKEKDAPEPIRRPATPEPPAAPPVVEYPKMLYHPDGRQVTVQNADEEAKAKKEGFDETPGSPEAPRGPRAK